MMRMRVPICTLTVALTAGVVFAVPTLEALFVYNREAIAHGELWRIVTGNAVHFSAAHFALDLAGFVVGGILLEAARPRVWTILCIASAAAVGALLYLAQPHVIVYGGLSGVVTAVFIYLSLQGATSHTIYRWVYITILVALFAKSIAELVVFQPDLMSSAFVPLPQVHAVGAAVAFLVFAGTRAPQLTALLSSARRAP
jgi:rhomboid family GlyGly-CTERM serine protease